MFIRCPHCTLDTPAQSFCPPALNAIDEAEGLFNLTGEPLPPEGP
ncbi:MAG: hypothetical protein RDV48_10875 [Candidatus Eremiobacteraeota bacterium]|nr:hypothetical protein [Candidatus Eremiobacteraeota bacterium]